MTLYGIIKCTLDDFSRLNTRWIPDLSTFRLFTRKEDRDQALEDLNEKCESYEIWRAVDAPIVSHKAYTSMWGVTASAQQRGEHGQFTKEQ